MQARGGPEAERTRRATWAGSLLALLTCGSAWAGDGISPADRRVIARCPAAAADVVSLYDATASAERAGERLAGPGLRERQCRGFQDIQALADRIVGDLTRCRGQASAEGRHAVDAFSQIGAGARAMHEASCR